MFAASEGLMLSVRGAGGVGTSRSASFASRCATDLRLRRLVNAVQGLGPAAGEEGSDLLVGEDHQLLDQRVRRRFRLEPGALDPALAVEARS